MVFAVDVLELDDAAVGQGVLCFFVVRGGGEGERRGEGEVSGGKWEMGGAGTLILCGFMRVCIYIIYNIPSAVAEAAA